MKTQRGLDVTTSSSEVIDSIDEFHYQILGSGKNADRILKAAQQNPDNLLLQTYAAMFYLYAQEHAATHIAANYLLQAEKAFRRANLREKLTYQAAQAWLRLDYEAALTLFAGIIALYPRDTLALKLAEWLYYCTGQAYQAKHFLALCQLCAKENMDDPYFLSIYSFALELCGQYEEAKAMAEQAIAKERVTPWAHHTLAHVYLFRSDIEGGIRTLQELKDTWETILPLLKAHNSWHFALFHLANRDETKTIEFFPKIFDTLPDTIGEQLDAISLLWRMDMAGLPQDKLFNTIASHLGRHPFEQYVAFNNAHFIYCLARIGDTKGVKQLLKTVSTYVETSPPGSYRDLWKNVALPMFQGISAFVQENYHEACKLMGPVIEQCYQLGGSDAQDELYTQTYLLSLLKSQQRNKAKAFFSKCLSHYQNTALADYWFNTR
ncbi:Uncharacterised protein [Legionella lansingensis]|uniref:Tetratricopeptide repeat protein 38 n=1 Tax=Legionella lansingensis TaxID=45067 RepID=A0A0W0VQV9_9GAMM|nr:tetratricopeptide repeat protein [Legionella lansingensis]KTD22317.1 hypothetical protein Llan_1258 [Legionella lansingensis]SNV50738.1 Uncharacterised protein [Legionella lansingensis]